MSSRLIDPAEVLAGGYNRSSLHVGPAAPVVDRGEGARLVLSDGRKVIDANGNFTVLVHGNAHPTITAAATEALSQGACFGLPTRYEVQHASRLVARFDRPLQVRYTNTGTEAVMLAVRLARAVTGRSRIVIHAGAYHGLADAVLPASGSHGLHGLTPGVLGDTTVARFDDEASLLRTLAEDPPAAVLLDLMPNKAGLVPIASDTVRAIRDITLSTGTVMVVDEVVSLRAAVGGLQSVYGVAPDFTTVGKIIGGGLPIGALLGTPALMERLDPRRTDSLEAGGTFTANPVSLAAGIASLDLLDHAAITRLNGFGERLRTELAAPLDRWGWGVKGGHSLARLMPVTGIDPERSLALWWAALDRGTLLMPTGTLALSTAMDSSVLDHLVTSLAEAVAAVESGRH